MDFKEQCNEHIESLSNLTLTNSRAVSRRNLAHFGAFNPILDKSSYTNPVQKTQPSVIPPVVHHLVDQACKPPPTESEDTSSDDESEKEKGKPVSSNVKDTPKEEIHPLTFDRLLSTVYRENAILYNSLLGYQLVLGSPTTHLKGRKRARWRKERISSLRATSEPPSMLAVPLATDSREQSTPSGNEPPNAESSHSPDSTKLTESQRVAHATMLITRAVEEGKLQSLLIAAKLLLVEVLVDSDTIETSVDAVQRSLSRDRLTKLPIRSALSTFAPGYCELVEASKQATFFQPTQVVADDSDWISVESATMVLLLAMRDNGRWFHSHRVSAAAQRSGREAGEQPVTLQRRRASSTLSDESSNSMSAKTKTSVPKILNEASKEPPAGSINPHPFTFLLLHSILKDLSLAMKNQEERTPEKYLFAMKSSQLCYELLSQNMLFVQVSNTPLHMVGLAMVSSTPLPEEESGVNSEKTLRGQANAQNLAKKLHELVEESLFSVLTDFSGRIQEELQLSYIRKAFTRMMDAARSTWSVSIRVFYPTHSDRQELLVKLLKSTSTTPSNQMLVETLCETLHHQGWIHDLVPIESGLETVGKLPDPLGKNSKSGNESRSKMREICRLVKLLLNNISQTAGLKDSFEAAGTDAVDDMDEDSDWEAPPATASVGSFGHGEADSDKEETSAKKAEVCDVSDDQTRARRRSSTKSSNEEVIETRSRVQSSLTDRTDGSANSDQDDDMDDEERQMLEQALSLSLMNIQETDQNSSSGDIKGVDDDAGETSSKDDEGHESESLNVETSTRAGRTDSAHSNEEEQLSAAREMTTAVEQLGQLESLLANLVRQDSNESNAIENDTASQVNEILSHTRGFIGAMRGQGATGSMDTRRVASFTQSLAMSLGGLRRVHNSRQVSVVTNESGNSSEPDDSSFLRSFSRRTASKSVESRGSSSQLDPGDANDLKKVLSEEATTDNVRFRLPPYYHRLMLLKSIQDLLIHAHQPVHKVETDREQQRVASGGLWVEGTSPSKSAEDELLLQFDESHCAETILVTNQGSTIVQQADKKWGTAILKLPCTRTSDRSVYRWQVRFNNCEKGHIFVGVATREASWSNYLGADKHGWGLIGTKNLWHNRSKQRSYGKDLRGGDTVTVTLDASSGTLSYSSKGSNWGTAFSDLSSYCTGGRALYPAVSLYQKGDSATVSSVDACDDFLPPQAGLGRNVSMLDMHERFEKSISSIVRQPSSTMMQFTAQLTDYLVASVDKVVPSNARPPSFGSPNSGTGEVSGIIADPVVQSVLAPLLASLALWPLEHITTQVSFGLLPPLLRASAAISRCLQVLQPSYTESVTGEWTISKFSSPNTAPETYDMTLEQQGGLVVGSVRQGDRLAKLRVPGVRDSDSLVGDVHGVVVGKRVVLMENWTRQGRCVSANRLVLVVHHAGDVLMGESLPVESVGRNVKRVTLEASRKSSETHSMVPLPPPHLSPAIDASSAMVTTSKVTAFAQALEELIATVLGKLISVLVSGNEAPLPVADVGRTSTSAAAPASGENGFETEATTEDDATDLESTGTDVEDDDDKEAEEEEEQSVSKEEYMRWSRSELLRAGFLQPIVSQFIKDRFELHMLLPAFRGDKREGLEMVRSMCEDQVFNRKPVPGDSSWGLPEKDSVFLDRFEKGSDPIIKLLDDWILRFAEKSAFLNVGGECMKHARRAVVVCLLLHTGVLQEARLISEWLLARWQERCSSGTEGATSKSAAHQPAGFSPALEYERPEDCAASASEGDQSRANLLAEWEASGGLTTEDIMKEEGGPTPSRMLVNVWKAAQRLVEWGIMKRNRSGSTFAAVAEGVLKKARLLLSVRPSAPPLLYYELDQSQDVPAQLASPQNRSALPKLIRSSSKITTSTFLEEATSRAHWSASLQTDDVENNYAQPTASGESGSSRSGHLSAAQVLRKLEYWKRVAKYTTAQKTSSSSEAAGGARLRSHNEAVDAVVSFMKSGVRVSELQDTMLQGSWRAYLRAAGLGIVRSMLEGRALFRGQRTDLKHFSRFYSPSAKAAMLQWLAPALSAPSPKQAEPATVSLKSKDANSYFAKQPASFGKSMDDPELSAFDLSDLSFGGEMLQDAAEAAPGTANQGETELAVSHHTTGHYLGGLGGCGMVLAGVVQSQFEDLYALLAAELESSSLAEDCDTQHALLNSWAVLIAPEDHEFISRVGLFRILRTVLESSRNLLASHLDSSPASPGNTDASLADGDSPESFSLISRERAVELWSQAATEWQFARIKQHQSVVRAAIKVVHLLASQIVLVGESSSSEQLSLKPTQSFLSNVVSLRQIHSVSFRRKPSGPGILGETVFEMLSQELRAVLDGILLRRDFHEHFPDSGSVSGSNKGLNMRTVNTSSDDASYCFEILQLLFSISVVGASVCRRYMSSPTWICLLLKIATDKTGFRLQQRALRLLGRLLPCLEADQVQLPLVAINHEGEALDVPRLWLDISEDDEDIDGMLDSGSRVIRALVFHLLDEIAEPFPEGVLARVVRRAKIASDDELVGLEFTRAEDKPAFETLAAKASEVVSLLRRLVHADSWRDGVLGALEDYLAEGQGASAPPPSELIRKRWCVTALLGGLFEVLRPCGLVRLSPRTWNSGASSQGGNLSTDSVAFARSVGVVQRLDSSKHSACVLIKPDDRMLELLSLGNDEGGASGKAGNGQIGMLATTVKDCDLIPVSEVYVPTKVLMSISRDNGPLSKIILSSFMEAAECVFQRAKAIQQEEIVNENSEGASPLEKVPDESDMPSRIREVIETAHKEEMEVATSILNVAHMKSMVRFFHEGAILPHFVKRKDPESPDGIRSLLRLASMPTDLPGLSSFPDLESWWGSLISRWHELDASYSAKEDLKQRESQRSREESASKEDQEDEASESEREGDTVGNSPGMQAMLAFGFPREVCEIALERCGQDPNTAIHFCLENSAMLEHLVQERLASRSGAASRRDALVAKLQEMGFNESWCAKAVDTSGEVTEDGLVAWILSNSARLAEEDKLATQEEPPTPTETSQSDLCRSKRSGEPLPLGVGGLTCTSGEDIIAFGSDMEVSVEGSRGGFPTACASGLLLSGGCWYLEVTVVTEKCMQVGWIDAAYSGSADEGNGVGDDSHSWSFDGFRQLKWNSTSEKWGSAWRAGDVVGMAVDLERGELWCSLNGRWDRGMGRMFSGLVAGKDYCRGLCPAASLNSKERLQFNFGDTVPFKHAPPAELGGFHRCRPLHEGFFSEHNLRLPSNSGDLLSNPKHALLETVVGQFSGSQDCMEEALGMPTADTRFFSHAKGHRYSHVLAAAAQGASAKSGSSRRGGVLLFDGSAIRSQRKLETKASGTDTSRWPGGYLAGYVPGKRAGSPLAAKQQLQEASRETISRLVRRTSVTLSAMYARLALLSVFVSWENLDQSVRQSLAEVLSHCGEDLLTYVKLVAGDIGADLQSLSSLGVWADDVQVHLMERDWLRGADTPIDSPGSTADIIPPVLRAMLPLCQQVAMVEKGSGKSALVGQLVKVLACELNSATARAYAGIPWDAVSTGEIFTILSATKRLRDPRASGAEPKQADEASEGDKAEGDDSQSYSRWFPGVTSQHFFVHQLTKGIFGEKFDQTKAFNDVAGLLVASLPLAVWCTNILVSLSQFPSPGFDTGVMAAVFAAWRCALFSPGTSLKRQSARMLSAIMQTTVASLTADENENTQEFLESTCSMFPISRVNDIATSMMRRFGCDAPVYSEYVQEMVELNVQGLRALRHTRSAGTFPQYKEPASVLDNRYGLSDAPLRFNGTLVQEPIPASENHTFTASLLKETASPKMALGSRVLMLPFRDWTSRREEHQGGGVMGTVREISETGDRVRVDWQSAKKAHELYKKLVPASTETDSSEVSPSSNETSSDDQQMGEQGTTTGGGEQDVETTSNADASESDSDDDESMGTKEDENSLTADKDSSPKKDASDASSELEDVWFKWGADGESDVALVGPSPSSGDGRSRRQQQSWPNDLKSASFGQQLRLGVSMWLESAGEVDTSEATDTLLGTQQVLGTVELSDFGATALVKGKVDYVLCDEVGNEKTVKGVINLTEKELLKGHQLVGWQVRLGCGPWIAGSQYLLESAPVQADLATTALGLGLFREFSGKNTVPLPHVKVGQVGGSQSCSPDETLGGNSTVVHCRIAHASLGSIMVAVKASLSIEQLRVKVARLYDDIAETQSSSRSSRSRYKSSGSSHEHVENLFLENSYVDASTSKAEMEYLQFSGHESLANLLAVSEDSSEEGQAKNLKFVAVLSANTDDEHDCSDEESEVTGDDASEVSDEDVHMDSSKSSEVATDDGIDISADGSAEEPSRSTGAPSSRFSAGGTVSMVTDVGNHLSDGGCLVLHSNVHLECTRPFRLSQIDRGVALSLRDDSMVAQLSPTSSEDRGLVLGDVGFSSGRHYWEIKVEGASAEYGSILVGVCEKSNGTVLASGAQNPSLNRWDRLHSCYGFVNFRATYESHGSSGSEQIYGEFFGVNDVVGVYLDMDTGFVSFFLDGIQFGQHVIKDLGVAFSQQQLVGFADNKRSESSPLTLFPVVGLRRSSSDKVRLSSKYISLPSVSPEPLLHNLAALGDALCAFELDCAGSKLPEDFVQRAWVHWKRWYTGASLRVFASRAGGKLVEVDASSAACERVWKASGLEGEPLGAGDLVKVMVSAGRPLDAPEEARVLGVSNNRYWYRVEGKGAGGGHDGMEECASLAWCWEDHELPALVIVTRAAGNGASVDSADDRSLEAFKAEAVSEKWSLEVDVLLVQLCNTFCASSGTDLLNMSLEEAVNRVQEAVASGTQLKGTSEPAWEVLKSSSGDAIGARLAVLRLLNSMASSLLPLASMRDKRGKTPWGRHSATSCSLGETLKRLRRLLMLSVKRTHWDAVLSATTTPTALAQTDYDDPPQIRVVNVNRIKAAIPKLVDLPSATMRMRSSVFGQLHAELHKWSDHSFRRAYIGKGHGGQRRAFRVRMLGEGVNDYGGPYRAIFEQVAEELQSDQAWTDGRPECLLPLLLPCPNRVNSAGDLGRDKFVLSCTRAASNPSLIKRFSFLGRLTGLAVRHHLQLGLNLPGLTWKQLSQEPVDRSDLMEIDSVFLNELDHVEKVKRTLENQDGSSLEKGEEAVAQLLGLERYLEVALSDGTVVPLVPRGSEVPLQPENLDVFVSRSEQARLWENATQLAALQRGVAKVLPVELFPMFTWQELEAMICGHNKVDLELLKQCTEYENVDPNEEYIQYFWSCMEEMDDEERASFLRFVWARSRMPSSQVEMPMKFKITQASGGARENPDDFLPRAQTCFFSLALPKYSSKDIMKGKLLYAMRCTLMDGDVRLRNAEGWADA